MRYTRLGRTGLEVSTIGLGTEHLLGQPRETVISVIREAIERGVNYFDLIFAFPEYLDNVRAALRGHRDRVFVTSHLGSTVRNGQYFKTRSVKGCETSFLDFLSRLGTDYVDVLMLHNFNSVNDWEKVSKPRGVLDLALRLQEEGKAAFIGISAHSIPVAQQAVESGQVDLVMFPVNLFGHALPGRKELLDLCLREEIGLVAMKPFGGGKLLTKRGTFRVPKYQTGGEAFELRIATQVTPVQCLSYVLAQVEVSLALPGVKNNAELAAALHTLEATEAEKDFGGLISSFGRYEDGVCVYCNHCLPCPAVIDIGRVNRLLDAAQWGITPSLQSAYNTLPVKASACTECGVCVERCPFGVEVIVKMRQATQLYGHIP